MKCPCCLGTGEVDKLDNLAPISILSPAEKTIYEACWKVPGILNAKTVGKILRDRSVASIRQQMDILFKYGLLEKDSRGDFRVTSAVERADGVALCAAEKDFLRTVEHMWKRFGTLSTPQIVKATGLTQPIVHRYLKVLHFAGHVKKNDLKRRNNWELIRFSNGKATTIADRVVTKPTYVPKPVRRGDTMIYPELYADGYYPLNGEANKAL